MDIIGVFAGFASLGAGTAVSVHTFAWFAGF